MTPLASAATTSQSASQQAADTAAAAAATQGSIAAQAPGVAAELQTRTTMTAAATTETGTDATSQQSP